MFHKSQVHENMWCNFGVCLAHSSITFRRTTCFTSDGLQIVTGGSDKSINIFDTFTGAVVSEYLVAHPENVSRVFALPAGEFGSLLASGDEGGELKLWDLRAGKHVSQCFLFCV